MGNSDLCPVVVVIQLMWIDLVKLAMVVRVSLEIFGNMYGTCFLYFLFCVLQRHANASWACPL